MSDLTLRISRLCVVSISIVFLSTNIFPQQRPLLTEDVEIIKPGVIRIESGFEFLQNQYFPLSGLRGDVTKLADTRMSFGLAPNVEFQIEWTFQNFLSITSRTPPAIPLKLGVRSEEHTSELQSLRHLVCRLLLEKKT